MKSGTPVMISWFDAFQHGSSHIAEEDLGKQTPKILHDVGWFVGTWAVKGLKYLTYAIEFSPEDGGDFRWPHSIPLVNVIEVRELKRGARLKP
jgi:hypothetical protein